jgi:SAM-dependent methyltransferase
MTKATPEPDSDQIRQFGYAVATPFAVLAGMQLDVFTPLREGPLDAEALAERLGVHARRLRPVLYALVGAELLTLEEERFANTPLAERFLIRGQPTYMGGVHELWSDVWHALLKTAESVRTGAPQAEHDFEAMPRAELAAFLRGQHPLAMAAGHALIDTLKPERPKTLLDVGGGSGGLAIGACEAASHLRATVVELPTVTPITEEFVAAAGLSDRIEIRAADVIRAPLEGSFDVAALRNLLQTLSVEQARQTLHHVGQAIAPGGSVMIIGFILDDTRLGPPVALAYNLFFLNAYEEGEAYTAGEHREWLEAAGFEDVRSGPAPPGFGTPGIGLITARRRHDARVEAGSAGPFEQERHDGSAYRLQTNMTKR